MDEQIFIGSWACELFYQSFVLVMVPHSQQGTDGEGGAQSSMEKLVL